MFIQILAQAWGGRATHVHFRSWELWGIRGGGCISTLLPLQVPLKAG